MAGWLLAAAAIFAQDTPVLVDLRVACTWLLLLSVNCWCRGGPGGSFPPPDVTGT